MGRNLDEIIAEMPPERQADVEARYQVLKQEVDGLRDLRLIAGKVQADISTAPQLKPPTVSKIESQAVKYLYPHRSFAIASASCRERGWKYGKLSGGADK